MDAEANTVSPPAQPARRPVVLHVLPSLEEGEASLLVMETAKFLVRAGGLSVVASAGGRREHDLVRGGVVHRTLPLDSKNPFTIRGNIGRLMDLIEEHDVDVVHAHSRAPAWSAFFAARRTGRAFLTSFQAPHRFGSPMKKFYNSVMTRGDRVIAPSLFIAQHAERTYGLSADRLRIIPPGIDLVRFNPDFVTAERMASLTQEWRLPDGLKVILCPGRLNRSRGTYVLLEALAKMGRRDFICVLMGVDEDGEDDADALESRAVKLGLEGHVTMMPARQDMATAYMLADVVVSPALAAEGFGRMVAEAQALGRPVVASDIGSMREAIIPGETGWLARVNDPAALGAAISQALDLTPQQRMHLATKAVTHAHTHFSRDEMCWATLDVYQELYGRAVPWAMPVAENTGT